MNDSQRKASDIIVDLEKKIDLLIQKIDASEFNNKLILANLNVLLGNKQPSKMAETKQAVVVSPKALPELIKPKMSKTDTSINKIPISQRILDNNGKDLFMADVIISTTSGELVNKLKTNTVGKWQAYLPVGNYNVKISKTNATTMKKIEKEQSFEVLGDVKSLQLPNLIVEVK